MKQKVLIIAIDASNEHDSSRIKVVSWQDGSVIETIYPPTQYLHYNDWNVEQKCLSSEEVWDIPELPFKVPEKMSTQEFYTLRRKIIDFEQEFCDKSDIKWSHYDGYRTCYNTASYDSNKKRIRYYFAVEDTDEVYAKILDAATSKFRARRPDLEFTPKHPMYPKQKQGYLILCPYHTERTFDNGEAWFNSIKDFRMRDLYKSLYCKYCSYDPQFMVRKIIEVCRPQYEVINIIHV